MCSPRSRVYSRMMHAAQERTQPTARRVVVYPSGEFVLSEYGDAGDVYFDWAGDGCGDDYCDIPSICEQTAGLPEVGALCSC